MLVAGTRCYRASEVARDSYNAFIDNSWARIYHLLFTSSLLEQAKHLF